jgi:glutamyl-tRNA(Gln) amidotransferase subunit E
MYPETDVPPVEPDVVDVDTPELLTEKVERYQREHGLDPDLAEQVAYGERMPLFERAVDMGVDPTLAASTVESTVTELGREGVPVENLTDDAFEGVFETLAAGDLPQEGVGDLLAALAAEPDLDVEEAIEQEDLGGVDEAAVREVVVSVVERNADQVESEGMGAFSALMGQCMGELRGKAEGEVVSDLLREEIGKRS